MDIEEITSRFASLPGQLPDASGEEPASFPLARLQFLENPQLFDLYRKQGLPVDACGDGNVFVLEPSGTSSGRVHPVLFEPGDFIEAGRLDAYRDGRTIFFAWSAPGRSVCLEIFELHTGIVSHLQYFPPAPSGRVSFIPASDVFSVRAQVHVQGPGAFELIWFSPRLQMD